MYGRLLCHVVTEDGVDFNLLLVRRGLSPYFNKYGNSLVCHDDFVRAQEAARREQLGIWHPRTNAGGRKRPYARLLPWWQARADALEAFRAKRVEAPLDWVDAERPEQLEAALSEPARRVTVIGSIQRFFDERNGDWTILFRSGARDRALRVILSPAGRDSHRALDLPGTQAEFRQNYLLVSGELVRTERGFELRGVTADDWRPAGPEPE